MKRFFCLIIIIAFLSCACTSRLGVAFTVNEISVEKEELLYYMQNNADIVAAQIEENYSLDSTKDGFWDTKVNDGKALDLLKSVAVEKITRIKIEQLEARKQGIDTEFSFSKQQAEWHAQNEERKSMENKGEVLYGPTEREFFTYFQEIYYKMQENLIENLVKKGVIAVEQQHIVAYYNENKSLFSDSFDNSREQIYSVLLRKHYDDYINKIMQEAVIEYQDMNVDGSIF